MKDQMNDALYSLKMNKMKNISRAAVFLMGRRVSWEPN